MSATVSPRLAALARRSEASEASSLEPGGDARCELCGGPLPDEHRHVADIRSRGLLCTCRGCALLLGRDGAGGGHFRLVPERRLLLDGFRLDDERWAALRLPVDLAFFFHATPSRRVVAFYPSPLGATESQLGLDAWEELERENPILAGLEPDVEALLVNRARGAREHFLVPIDVPYELVALIRSRWRGLAGGSDVWDGIAQFFERLRAQARTEVA